jgi:hypothetical protein
MTTTGEVSSSGAGIEAGPALRPGLSGEESFSAEKADRLTARDKATNVKKWDFTPLAQGGKFIMLYFCSDGFVNLTI